MKYGNFEPLLKSWAPKFKSFIESPKMDKIYAELKSRSGKVRTAPMSSDVFKAFEKCDYSNLRAILVGFCPYHTFKGDMPVADGLMLSCSKTGVLQPSIEIVYDAIEKDLYNGLNLSPRNPDLTYLSSQGVLLYNVALTTQENKAGSDVELWSEFNKFFFEEIINKYQSGIPILFFGQVAAKSEKLVAPMLHYTKVVEHPAASSYSGKDWRHDNCFSWVNNILEQNNGKHYKINWLDEEPPF